MADETPKPELIRDTPQINEPLDAANHGLPAQPAPTDIPARDVIMSDAPMEQLAVRAFLVIHTWSEGLLLKASPFVFSHRSTLCNTTSIMAIKADKKMKSSPAPAPYAPSPIPARNGTPAQGSRAASAHPDPGFSMPTEVPPHGDETRRYLNTKVTGVLLEDLTIHYGLWANT
ncbi:hypothetical protein G7046_g8911 [Stylonectria norvegica]|nr:hypothetical protein G7046_g8911 [Stylonectria norvegica]